MYWSGSRFELLTFIVFIATIAAFVQLVEMAVEKVLADAL